MATIIIPDQNAFTIRLNASNRISGDYTEAADLGDITNLVINYVRRGIRFPQTYTIDEDGRAVIVNQGTLDCGFYGIELTGYYAGIPFRFYGKDLFEISNDDTNAIDPSDIIDIDIIVKLNASGVSKDYVDHAIDGMEADMEAMQADFQERISEAGSVKDVKVNGVSVVSNKNANITVPTKVSDLQNDSGFQNAQQVAAAVAAVAINEVSVDYEEDGGEPDADATIEDRELILSLKNMKMKFSELTEAEKEEIRGRQGLPGDSVLVGQGDLPLANARGDSSDKAITQKAVTRSIISTEKDLGEWTDIAYGLTRKQCCIDNSTGKWSWKTSGTGSKKQMHSAIPVTPGEVLIVKATSTNQNGMCAWLTDSYTGTATSGATPPYVDGTTLVSLPVGVEHYLVVPDGAAWFVMVNSSVSAVVTTWEVRKKNAGNSAGAKLELKAITSVGTFNGSVDFVTGELVSATATQTNLYKKFPIDPNKVYYADVRAYYNQDYQASGVAYFDENDTFVCSECFNHYEAYEKKKVRLNVPQNAAYCYILGTDGTYFNTDTVPRLYVADYVQNESVMNYHETLVASFALIGEGSTMVNKYLTSGIKPGTLYRIEVAYDTWTMPDPTASTTGLGVFDTINGVDKAQKTIQQRYFGDGIDEMTFITNENAEGIRISMRAGSGEIVNLSLYEVRRDKEIVNDAISYGKPETARSLYNITRVKGVVLKNGENGSIGVEETEIDSAWAVILPPSYSQNGKPTQVIAMLHGASGYVAPGVTGYSVQKWKDWQNLYLSHGFAVLETNGWGISTSSDNKSRHWACPPALETIDKAFETIKSQYNIADKLMLHGTSMGGATAWAYALSHPNKVSAIGLFSPATLSWIMLKDRNLENDYELSALNWQYESVAEAISDDFQRIVGYDPIIAAMRYKDGLYTPISQLANHDVLQYGEAGNEYILVGHALPFPVRIWHGTSDPTVPYKLSEIVVNAYRRGGQNVSMRYCPGETHAICTGGTQYVCEEAVDFFEMYR